MESTAPATEGSVASRMMNVLAAPGEVYSDLKERPVRHSNWLAPALVWTVIGSVMAILLFSQDWAIAEIRRAQRKEMDKQVATGKMSRQAADQADQFMDKYFPLMMKISSVVFTFVMAFAVPFIWGFVIWMVGTRFLGADFEYMKGVESAGLAMVIYTLASVVGVLISFAMGKMTFLSPAILINEIDLTNKQHLAMAALNPLYLWFAGAIAVATSRLAGASFGKAAAFIFGFWILLRAILIITPGLGNFAL